MIKSLLYITGKELLFMAGLFLATFILSAGISIQLKPFHISFNHPAFGIGLTLMVIGFAICMGSAYCSGREHGDYDTGYKKGSDDTLECIRKHFEEIKEKESVTFPENKQTNNV